MLLSQPDVSLAGVLPLVERRWRRLSNDNHDELDRDLDTLADSGFLLIDENTGEVWIRTFPRHDGVLRSPKTRAGMWDAYRNIMSPRIRAAFVAAIGDELTAEAKAQDWVSDADLEAENTLSDTPTEGLSPPARADFDSDTDTDTDENNRRAPRVVDITGPPTTASHDTTLATTLYRWFVDRGERVESHDRRSDDYRRLLALCGQHYDIRDGPYKRIAEKLCREYAAEVTGDELSKPAVSHMRRIIGQCGGEAALQALADAVTRGAGLGEWELDERALTKYANAILSNQAKAAR